MLIIWVMEGPITIDFPEKGASVDSTFYCQLLSQNSFYFLNDPHITTHVNKISDISFLSFEYLHNLLLLSYS